MRIDLRAVERRLLTAAPWLLAGMLVYGLTLFRYPDHRAMIDLRVYHDAAPHLLTGKLYDFTYSELTPDFPLPFTYPPFAALALLPVAALPWLLARAVWYLVLLACLLWLVHSALRLVAGPRWEREPWIWQRRVLLCTAVVLWFEPIRMNFYFGQVNLVLAAVLLACLVHVRPALAGLGVGLAAGVKLTPAVSGLYFLVTRRWAAAGWSVAAFAATVLLGWLVTPGESRRFWLELLPDAGRVGPIGSVMNQSLRGALSRTLGYDTGNSTPWLIAVLAALVLAGFALRTAVRASDPLAAIVVVEMLGLLVSPISWTHHWVWLVPALVWLCYSRAWAHPLARIAAAAWAVVAASFVISFLLRAQPTIWVIPRPWYLSALGWVYPVCAVLTLLAVACAVPSRPTAPVPAEPRELERVELR